MREPGRHISADEQETARIIEIARDFDNAGLIRCYELTSEVFAGLNKYTANKRVAVEMLLCQMCLTRSAGAAQVPAGAAEEKPAAAIRPQANNTSGKFAGYADMIEEIAKENKIVSQYLKGAPCELDGGRLIIKADSDFKANILRDNLGLIKKYAERFTGGACEVLIELPKKADDGGNGNSIDDINL